MDFRGFPGGSDGRESACNAGDLGSIPGSGRSPGQGNGTPLQYSCLKNSMDRGAWWAVVHGVANAAHNWVANTHILIIICLNVDVFESILLPNLLSFLVIYIHVFHQIWEVFSYLKKKKFFSAFYSLFSPACLSAVSLQSCPTLCNPIDISPPGSPIPGILQARTLEWVAISFSNAWSEKWKWSHSVLSDPQWPHGLQPTRLLHPWDFPGKSTRVGCHFDFTLYDIL